MFELNGNWYVSRSLELPQPVLRHPALFHPSCIWPVNTDSFSRDDSNSDYRYKVRKGSSQVRDTSTPKKIRPTKLRIIGGSMRGRGVLYNGDLATRPMKDSIRETVFNILGHSVDQCIAWDLFAGTGVLAMESLSRGAAQAIAIEKSTTTSRQIRQSADAIDIGDELLVLTGDTFRIAMAKMSEISHDKMIGQRPWIVYACPPYVMWLEDTQRMFHLLQETAELAPAGSQLVIEADKHFDASTLPLSPWDIRPKGNVTLGFYEKA